MVVEAPAVEVVGGRAVIGRGDDSRAAADEERERSDERAATDRQGSRGHEHPRATGAPASGTQRASPLRRAQKRTSQGRALPIASASESTGSRSASSLCWKVPKWKPIAVEAPGTGYARTPSPADLCRGPHA